MADITISDLPSALQMLETMVIPVDKLDPVTQTTSTEKVSLTQILALFASIGNIPPTGIAHVWPTENIPTGYLELNGQSFDKLTYPELGLIFPSGVLPDWRGRVAKHTPTGATAGTTEEDQIKSHSHTITVNSTNLGTKSAASAGAHTHTLSLTRTEETGARSGQYYANGTTIEAAQTWTTNSGGAHTHSVVMGSHSHTATCATVGGTENTVKGVFVRYIVRAK